ncbi:MAG: hypothetical protein AB1665_06890 [Candidatus Thermoplasmatota archaeon]
MSRSPFILFRTLFVVVALACWAMLAYSTHTYIETAGFGSHATLERVVLVEDKLSIQFSYEAPSHLDTRVLGFEVNITVGSEWIRCNGPLDILVEKGEREVFVVSYTLDDDEVRMLQGSQIVTLQYSFEIYSPYRDASSDLTGCTEAYLEVEG